MRVVLYASRNPPRVAWKGRAWEWFPLQLISPRRGTSVFRRTSTSSPATGISSPAMAFGGDRQTRRRRGFGLLAGLPRRNGRLSRGGKAYKLHVPGPVPGKLFWSMTLYDVDTRCLIATDQDKAAIRSLLDKPQANADGSYDLYFGPKAPAGKEALWIKTIPGKGWWSAFRIYGPQAPAFDGTWRLNDIIEVR